MRLMPVFGAALLLGLMALGVLRYDTPGAAASPGAVASLEATAVVTGAVAQTPAVRGVRPVGVNVGLWTYWGAEQLSSNVLKNPGFEGMVDRAIVIVHSADTRTFTDNESWTGRADDFWKNAAAEVRTGQSAGRRTRIVHSKQIGRSGLPEFESAEPLALAPGDVVALTRIDDSAPPANWWIPPDSAAAVGVTADRRPGSTGARSVRLRTRHDKPTEIISYLDTMADRAGKMLPVRGNWKIAFWTAARNGGGALRVRFFRQGAEPFLDRIVSPSTEWQPQSFEFSAGDDGPAAPLELHFQALGSGGDILLDDVELRSAEDDSAFRRPVIDALAALRPGLLRDWQGQLGDTFDNRVADAFARRTMRYRAGNPGESDYLYSLADFLDLCRRVGADPWIVAPVAFGDAEWESLGRFLAAEYRRGGFSEMLVEFGNENWNSLFRYAAIPDAAAHGEAAARAVDSLRRAAGAGVPLRFLVNAQHADPARSARIVAKASAADAVAVAPYFFPALAPRTPLAGAWEAMFADDGGKLRQIVAADSAAGKETAVYEVNVNTLQGDAPQRERDAATVGRVAASALAARLLEAYALGIRRQCVWGLSGFDVYLSPVAGRTRLFGLVRDFGATRRFRPSGLAVELLNRVVRGDLHVVKGISPNARISAYAFRSPAGWSLAVVSSAPQAQDVAFEVPGSEPLPTHVYEIAADRPDSTNEDSEEVRIVEEALRVSGRTVTISAPAWGLAVLTPRPLAAREGRTM